MLEFTDTLGYCLFIWLNGLGPVYSGASASNAIDTALVENNEVAPESFSVSGPLQTHLSGLKLRMQYNVLSVTISG